MGFLSSVLGKGKKNGSKQPKNFKKADMGDSMQFYYNAELKMFVERGKEHEAAAAKEPPPAPPKWKAPSGNSSAPAATGKAAPSGPHARFAALPGLEQTTPAASPGSLAPSFSRPKTATRSPNVKTFVPNIAAARAAAAAEQEDQANAKSEIAENPDGSTGAPVAEQARGSASIPSRVGAYASTGPPQSLSDPGHLLPPNLGPFASSPTAAAVNGAGAVNGSALASHPLQSKETSPAASPEPHAGFGSFMHAQVSPDGLSGEPGSVTKNTDAPAVQPAQMEPVPQSPAALPNGGRVNGHDTAEAGDQAGPYPDVQAGGPPAAVDLGDVTPGNTINAAAEGCGGDTASDHPQAPGASGFEMAGVDAEYDAGHDAGLYNDHGYAAGAGAGEVYSEEGAAEVPQYATAPPDNVTPSPWVSYWYSDWPTSLWGAVYDRSPELFYYHFQMKTQAEGWGDAEWEEYREQNPEHCEHIEYFNVEWGGRGTPMWPLPQEGEPLVGGGVATAAWLSQTQAAIEAAQADGDGGAAAAAMSDPADAYVPEAGVANGAVEDTADAGEAVAIDAVPMEALSEEVTLMQPAEGDGAAVGQATPRMLSADALVAADAEPVAADAHDALDRLTNGHAVAEDPGYFPGSAKASPNRKVLNLEDLDYVPNMEQVQELIARYAVPMRPESCAGSDDDRLYRAQPAVEASPGRNGPANGDAGDGVHRDRCGPSSRCSSSSSDAGGSEEDDDGDGGGPDPGQDADDVEDGMGDMGSMLAVASPSSCHRHDEEARVITGALGTAVAAADSAAAMRHLEAALETQQSAAEAAPSVDASCANSVHLSDGQSEAPSSMYVHAPSEAVMEETDGASNAAGGFVELPNIPEGSADLEDIPVLPPMHGDVPSTTRPEINITDLERRGMRVGAHTASCAAEAATSDKGSDDDGGAGGGASGSGTRNTAPSVPGGASSTLGHSSNGAGVREPMPPAAGSAAGVPGDGAARRILEELGRMHALLHAAGASGEIPGDITSLFGSLQQHMEDVAGSMRGHKTLSSQLEAPAASTSAAAQAALQAEPAQQEDGPGLLATPSRSEAVPGTPIHTPGILSNMSTPEPHGLPEESAPATTGAPNLPMRFQYAAENPLYANTMSPVTSGPSAGAAAAPAADAPVEAAVVTALQAELATMTEEAEGLRRALEGSTTENEELRQRLMEAEAREEEAAARLQAALSARDAAQAELRDAQEAEGEMRARLEEAVAQNASMQEAIAAARQATEDVKAAAAEQAAIASAAAAEEASAAEQAAAAQTAALQQQLQEAEAAVAEQTRTLAAAQAQAMAAGDAERAEADEARAAQAVAAAALEAAEAAATALQSDVAAARAAAAAAAAAAEAKAVEAAEVADALQRSEAERAAAAAELQEARRALEALQQEQAATQESLRAAAEAQRAAMAGQKAAEAECVAVRERADGAEASAAAVQAQVEAAEQAAALIRQELFVAQQEGAALSEQLQEAQNALEAAQAEASAAAQRCSEAEAAVAELEADLDLSVMAMGMETDKVIALEAYAAELGGDATELLERIEEEHTAAQEAMSAGASDAGSRDEDDAGGEDDSGAAAASAAGDTNAAVYMAADAGGSDAPAEDAAAAAEDAVPDAAVAHAAHADSPEGEGTDAGTPWDTEIAVEDTAADGGDEPEAEDRLSAGVHAEANGAEDIDAPGAWGGWGGWEEEVAVDGEGLAAAAPDVSVPEPATGTFFGDVAAPAASAGAVNPGTGASSFFDDMAPPAASADAAAAETATTSFFDSAVAPAAPADAVDPGPGPSSFFDDMAPPAESADAAAAETATTSFFDGAVAPPNAAAETTTTSFFEDVAADPAPAQVAAPTAAPSFFGDVADPGGHWEPPQDAHAGTAHISAAAPPPAPPMQAATPSFFDSNAPAEDGWGAWGAEHAEPAIMSAADAPVMAAAAPETGGGGFFDRAEAAAFGGEEMPSELAAAPGGYADNTAAALGGAGMAVAGHQHTADASSSGAADPASEPPAAFAAGTVHAVSAHEHAEEEHGGGFFDSLGNGSADVALPPQSAEPNMEASGSVWPGPGAAPAGETSYGGHGHAGAQADAGWGNTGGWGGDAGWGNAGWGDAHEQDGWAQGGWGDSAWGAQGNDAGAQQSGGGWGGCDDPVVEPAGGSGDNRFFV